MNPDNPTFRTEAEEKRAEEYKRLVEENDKLKRIVEELHDDTDCMQRTVLRLRKACRAHEETIATQKRVLERLKIIERDFTHHDGDCTEEDSDDNGQPCNCGLDRIRDEIAAIEKGKREALGIQGTGY